MKKPPTLLLLFISFSTTLFAQKDSIEISLLNGKWDFIETIMNETQAAPTVSMDLSPEDMYDRFSIDSTNYGIFQSFYGYQPTEYAALKYEIKDNKPILIFTYKDGKKSIGEIILMDKNNLKIKFDKHIVIYKRD